jgi:glycosyltransferase involved in cell wall biosynthesis
MEMYAVIPTYNRPNELLNLVTQLTHQGVREILVINNGGSLHPAISDTCHVYHDTNRDPHIYEMWNYGLGFWSLSPDHCVAILNDDVEIPQDFVTGMTQRLRDTDTTIAFPDQGPGIVNQISGNVCRRGCTSTCAVPRGCKTLQKRITGYCFVVNAAHGIRCDDSFKWWYVDDDLDWTARRDFNGTVEVQGVTVKHLYPSESTNSNPKRLAQADRDRETFIKKWGKAPW